MKSADSILCEITHRTRNSFYLKRFDTLCSLSSRVGSLLLHPYLIPNFLGYHLLVFKVQHLLVVLCNLATLYQSVKTIKPPLLLAVAIRELNVVSFIKGQFLHSQSLLAPPLLRLLLEFLLFFKSNEFLGFLFYHCSESCWVLVTLDFLAMVIAQFLLESLKGHLVRFHKLIHGVEPLHELYRNEQLCLTLSYLTSSTSCSSS